MHIAGWLLESVKGMLQKLQNLVISTQVRSHMPDLLFIIFIKQT